MKTDDPRIDKMVLTWQKTRDDELGAEIYYIFKDHLEGRIHKAEKYKIPEIRGIIYFVFANCLINYKAGNISFGNFLGTYVRYAIIGENRTNRFVKENTPQLISLNKQIKTSFIGASLENLIENAKEKQNQLDSETYFLFKEAIKIFNIEEADQELITLRLLGYSQEEIGKKFGVTQTIISKRLRHIKSGKKYNGLKNFLKNNLN